MIDNPTNCGTIMDSNSVCFHPSNFNQYGVSPSGKVPKVQLDTPTKLKGKNITKEAMGE
jgi:hypothetical protein